MVRLPSLVAFCCTINLVAAASSRLVPNPAAFNVEWAHPSDGPGTTQGGKATYMDAMPLGNGRTTALAWANVTTGGVGIYLGSQEALSGQTELFKLALIQLSVTPNPFTPTGHFNQALDLASGTVVVEMGTLRVRVWVDANADVLRVDATSTTPVSIQVRATSTRPSTPWRHSGDSCMEIVSNPDVYADPLPLGRFSFTHPGPNAHPFRHASADRRPLRTLTRLPGSSAFDPASIVAYHRNDPSEGDNLTVIFTQQGIESLIPTTPDHWTDRQSGFVLSGGLGAAPLRRVDLRTLVSTAPNTSFAFQATVLAVQTQTEAEWFADLLALVAAAAPPSTARTAHEAWWATFWARSHIIINQTQWTPPPPPPSPSPPPPPPPPPMPPVVTLPVPGAVLWLRAGSLAHTHTNGDPVVSWGEPSIPNASVSQTTPTLAPVFVPDGFGVGAPAVRFDGTGAFLANSRVSLPGGASGPGSTHFAVFRDRGTKTSCCSGVLFWERADIGISTDSTGNGVIALADGPGLAVPNALGVANRTVLADATYTTTGAVNFSVATCASIGTYPAPPATATGVMIGTRNNELGRYFKGDVGEIIVYPRTLTAIEHASVRAYIAGQWPETTAVAQCAGGGNPDAGFKTSQMYAITRYTQAVQSRNTMWPIKFNGMAFIAAMGSDGEADTRGWGGCNWWQNTRLPYGAMLPAGDFDEFQVLMKYKSNQQKLLSQRTPFYWNHTGMWTTETSHLSGAYCPEDYGCNRDPKLPIYLEASGYLHVDQGGDSGTGEYSLMALDYLLWSSTDPSLPTPEAKEYLSIATEAAEYFMNHFNNRSQDGRVIVWPAQVLETYWCTYNTSLNMFTNCCENDSPTISGMIGLIAKLIALPAGLATSTQRAAWQHFRDNLMPLLPIITSPDGVGNVIAPAEVVSTGKHNGEGPELYAIHPHRLFTKGVAVATGLNISLGELTVNTSLFAHGTSGWNYGINAYALIGDALHASTQLLGRVFTPPASGYRFDGFAPHEQDFDPSSDHFANMNRALLEMLIQSGDDGFTNTTIVLFPAWPCTWDVTLKLWGPMNTSVEVDYAGGKLVSPLIVEPLERSTAVKFANCIV